MNIDLALRLGIFGQPIRPGENENEQTDSPRYVWTGGSFSLPRSNCSCVVGFLFMLTPNITARFWVKVKRGAPDECWLWTASTTPFGYGKMIVNGKLLGAHCISWAIHHGSFCENSVLHKCDVPPCVNPGHLFEGTQRDNLLDCLAKGRANRPGGEAHCNAKLTDALAIYIRQQAPRRQNTDIARELGLSDETVRCVVKGKTWKHLLKTHN